MRGKSGDEGDHKPGDACESESDNGSSTDLTRHSSGTLSVPTSLHHYLALPSDEKGGEVEALDLLRKTLDDPERRAELDTWLKGLPDSNRNDVVAELKQVAATFEYAASEARDDASFVGDLGNAGGILGGGTVAILIGSASPVAPIVIVCAALGGAVFVAGKMLKRRKERVANSDKLRAELSKQIANAKKD